MTGVTRNLGGIGESWSVILYFQRKNGRCNFTTKKRCFFHILNFKAERIKRAKKIIFDYVCGVSEKYKDKDSLEVYVLGTPLFREGGEFRFVKDRMLRNRFKFFKIPNFIKANPDDIFIEGCGPEMAEELLEELKGGYQ